MIKKITRSKLEAFLSRYASKERVLDVGAGGSEYGRFFPNRITVDIDPARKPDIVADAHNLPFADGEFSFILCTEMLEHVRDPKRVISELKRLLKPGGRLVLTTRFVFPLHDTPHDYWRFTTYGLQELFKEWKIIECVPETTTFSALGVLFQRIGFQTRMRGNKFSKLVIFFLAWTCTKLDGLILEEFGDIKRSHHEPTIMTSGYYIVADM